MLRDLAIRAESYIHNVLLKSYIPDLGHTQVDSEFIKTAISEYSEATDQDPDVEYIWLDKHYFAPDRLMVDMTKLVGLLPYRPERFDCEDYAALYKVVHSFVLGVNAVGIVIDWSGGHAYNIVIKSDGSVSLIEPQSNTVVLPGLEDKYSFKRILIYI